MITSGVPNSEGRKARNAALRMCCNSPKSRCRMAIASASACCDELSFRADSGTFESQRSGGRIIQSHSAKSPRNSSRMIWMGARENSPKRKRLRVARTKSATSYTCRMASCVRSRPGGPGWQGEKEQELEGGHQFEDQGQLLLKSQYDHQRHHGEPLPPRSPEPFDPARKAEQVRQERPVSRVDWHRSADARDGEEPGEEQLEQDGSLIHAGDCGMQLNGHPRREETKTGPRPVDTCGNRGKRTLRGYQGEATESWNLGMLLQICLLVVRKLPPSARGDLREGCLR